MSKTKHDPMSKRKGEEVPEELTEAEADGVVGGGLTASRVTRRVNVAQKVDRGDNLWPPTHAMPDPVGALVNPRPR